MSETRKPTRTMITGDSRPALPRHIKLRHDAGRDRWIILAPERVFNPDETAVAVLRLCDGQRSVNEIAKILSEEYQAPTEEITNDIVAMLQDLSDKGVVTA
jgi:pyrroloquinoline quinone biosynthesis protein D